MYSIYFGSLTHIVWEIPFSLNIVRGILYLASWPWQCCFHGSNGTLKPKTFSFAHWVVSLWLLVFCRFLLAQLTKLYSFFHAWVIIEISEGLVWNSTFLHLKISPTKNLVVKSIMEFVTLHFCCYTAIDDWWRDMEYVSVLSACDACFQLWKANFIQPVSSNFTF